MNGLPQMIGAEMFQPHLAMHVPGSNCRNECKCSYQERDKPQGVTTAKATQQIEPCLWKCLHEAALIGSGLA
jgi:hypothetical protein